MRYKVLVAFGGGTADPMPALLLRGCAPQARDCAMNMILFSTLKGAPIAFLLLSEPTSQGQIAFLLSPHGMCKRSTVQKAKSSFLTGQLNTSAASHLAQAKRARSLKIRMVGILSFVSMVTARGNGQRPREPKPCRRSRLHPDEPIVLLRRACWVDPFYHFCSGSHPVRLGSSKCLPVCLQERTRLGRDRSAA